MLLSSTNRQPQAMDPQQRLLLEVAYEGLENGRPLLQIMLSRLMINSWHSSGQNHGHKDILFRRVLLSRLYRPPTSGSRVCTHVSVHKRRTITCNDSKQAVLFFRFERAQCHSRYSLFRQPCCTSFGMPKSPDRGLVDSDCSGSQFDLES